MFTDEVTELSRVRLADRYRLLPYLYGLADEAARTGAPMLRPLVWDFPADLAVRDLGDQAMLGPFVLVAPIVTPGATSRRVYLPAGRWTEFHSGTIHNGPATIEVGAPLAALPVFVRDGAILPVTEADGSLAFDVYAPALGAPAATFTLYEDDGESFTGVRTAVSIEAMADGARVTLPASRTFVVRLHGVDGAVIAVEGASSFAHDVNARTITAVATSAELRFRYDAKIVDLAPPVAVTFEVRTPADTPQATNVHVAISALNWTHVPLPWVAPGLARGTITVPRGAWFDYKVTRGGWATVEKTARCEERANRYRMAAPTLVVDTVAAWGDRCP